MQNVSDDPGKWGNTCEEKLPHSLLVWVKQEKGIHSPESLQNEHWAEGIWYLLPAPRPQPLNFNCRINLQVWVTGLNVSCPKTLFSILVPMASPPVLLDYLICVCPKASFISHTEVMCFVFCTQKPICLITPSLKPIMKSKMHPSPNVSLPPVQLL